jgi:inorganic pyrophosphatase
LVNYRLRKEQVNRFLGKIANVTVDRQIGAEHPKHEGLIYPVNYGYIAGEIAPDGEELDAYILGADKPLESFKGRVIAIIHRLNDVEDKLVVAPSGQSFSADEITTAIHFQEQYYRDTVELWKGSRK